MIVFLAAIACLFVVIFFLSQALRQDDNWRRFRERYRARQHRLPPQDPVDPNFQFEQPAEPENGTQR